MKIIFASDSFKGTLSSEIINCLLSDALKEIMPEAECIGIPMADGGEGTTDAVVKAASGEKKQVRVHDPLGREIMAEFGILPDGSAILEMASASGLPLLEETERDPQLTSTFGTGELIREVIRQGYRRIYVAIGGSATNDGGTGCLRALGVRFLDEDGEELEGKGQDLIRIREIDDTGLLKEIKEMELIVLSDVTNPLTGEKGATFTFGPQKGATPDMLQELEAGMENYRRQIVHQYGSDPNEIPGSGAAGGLGTALSVFLQAKMQSGIETVLELVHFDEILDGADYVITGEGRTDWQSAYGKVIYGVGSRAQRKNVKVIDLCGSLKEDTDISMLPGITAVYTTMEEGMTLEYALDHAEELYRRKAAQVFEDIKNRVL